jgi:hypothetical protein
MFDICVPVLGPNVNGTVPNNTGPSNNLTATLTDASLGLYTPTFVRDAPFINPGTVPDEAELENSTAPKEFGVANKLTQISSKDFASRGDSVNVLAGCDPNR